MPSKASRAARNHGGRHPRRLPPQAWACAARLRDSGTRRGRPATTTQRATASSGATRNVGLGGRSQPTKGGAAGNHNPPCRHPAERPAIVHPHETGLTGTRHGWPEERCFGQDGTDGRQRVTRRRGRPGSQRSPAPTPGFARGSAAISRPSGRARRRRRPAGPRRAHRRWRASRSSRRPPSARWSGDR